MEISDTQTHISSKTFWEKNLSNALREVADWLKEDDDILTVYDVVTQLDVSADEWCIVVYYK